MRIIETRVINIHSIEQFSEIFSSIQLYYYHIFFRRILNENKNKKTKQTHTHNVFKSRMKINKQLYVIKVKQMFFILFIIHILFHFCVACLPDQIQVHCFQNNLNALTLENC